jgi:DNA transformation protein and related proteins
VASPAFTRLSDDVLRCVQHLPKGGLVTMEALALALDVPVRHVAFIKNQWLKQSAHDKDLLEQIAGLVLQKNLGDGQTPLSLEALGFRPTLLGRPLEHTKLPVAPNRSDLALADVPGLGGKSAAILAECGITSAAQILGSDAFALYAQLKQKHPKATRHFLYVFLGFQSQKSWQDVAKDDKTMVLMRLEDLGLLPKQAKRRG